MIAPDDASARLTSSQIPASALPASTGVNNHITHRRIAVPARFRHASQRIHCPAVSEPAPEIDSPLGRNTAVIAAAAVVLLAVIWVVSQSGIDAAATGKFAAVLVLGFDALLRVGAIWLAAAGFGAPLRRWLLPDVQHGPIVQLGLGLAVALLGNWMLACLGMLNTVKAWGWCALGIALLLAQLVMAARAEPDPDAEAAPRLTWILPAAMLGPGLMLVAAACPPGTLWQIEAFGYDVLSYHLQLPREWIAAGALTGLEHNVYSYLPRLVEAAYMQLGLMHGGSMLDAIYTCQFFHASLAGFTAVALACAAARFAGQAASVLAGGVFLALPWIVIVGSMAYNEMAMLAFGAVALIVMFDSETEKTRGGAAMGILLGAATLAKPTAGLLLAVPIGLIMLAGWNNAKPWRRSRGWRTRVRVAAVMAGVGLLVLLPYFARNTIWTGNPVFPFAADVLGRAHWSAELAQRWDAAHGLSWSDESRAGALARQWALNTGYGALGGYETPRETENIARFSREGGFPLLWLVVAGSCIVAMRQRGTQRAVAALLALIALQIGAWLAVTHLQSRFLIPTLLPATMLVGIGLGWLHEKTVERHAWLMPTIGTTLVVIFTLSSVVVMFRQTVGVTGPGGQRRHAAPALLIDSLARPDRQRRGMVGHHIINRALPRHADTRTYMVADNSQLLYIRRPFTYHSAFDESQLGRLMRKHDGDAEAVTAALRERGITHVWAHYSELRRLHNTYGYDESVTKKSIERLAEHGWRRVRRFQRQTADGRTVTTACLFALPNQQ